MLLFMTSLLTSCLYQLSVQLPHMHNIEEHCVKRPFEAAYATRYRSSIET